MSTNSNVTSTTLPVTGDSVRPRPVSRFLRSALSLYEAWFRHSVEAVYPPSSGQSSYLREVLHVEDREAVLAGGRAVATSIRATRTAYRAAA